MKSPHPTGWEAYKDPFPNRTIYMEEEQLIQQSYTFLGWQNGWGETNPKEYSYCVNHAHNYHSSFPNAWKSKQHTNSGSDVTQWCTKCRIYWKIDMSD